MKNPDQIREKYLLELKKLHALQGKGRSFDTATQLKQLVDLAVQTATVDALSWVVH